MFSPNKFRIVIKLIIIDLTKEDTYLSIKFYFLCQNLCDYSRRNCKLVMYKAANKISELIATQLGEKNLIRIDTRKMLGYVKLFHEKEMTGSDSREWFRFTVL